MRGRGSTISALALSCGAIAAVALTLTAAPAERRTAPFELTGGGAIRVSNSAQGKAFLSADGLAPGHAASGSVTLTNRGSEPASLRLRQRIRPAGGRVAQLAPELRLRVSERVRGGRARRYSGSMAALDEVDLGPIAPRQARTLRFRVRLPEGAEDPLQESRIAAGYRWTAGPLRDADDESPAPGAGATGSLPYTGLSLAMMGLIALLLLGAGLRRLGASRASRRENSGR